MKIVLVSIVLCAGCSMAGRSFSAVPANVAREGARVSAPHATQRPAYVPQRGRGWFATTKLPGRLIYVTDTNAVYIFPELRGRSPVGEITDGISSAYGLCFDRRGNLYVANQYDNDVTMYPRGQLAPSRSYSASLARPLYPLVDSEGRLWVSNANNGTVVVYSRDGSHVRHVLQTPGVEADGMDFDSKGDLFVAYRYSGGTGSIEEFPAGSKKGTVLGMTLDQPQSIIVLPSGTILAAETGNDSSIDVFPPGYTTPVLRLSMSDVPTQLAVTNAYHELYVSSFTSDAVYISSYPLEVHGDPNQLHEKFQVSGTTSYGYGYGTVQGLAITNGQVF